MKEITVTANTEAEAHDLLAMAWQADQAKSVEKKVKRRGFLSKIFGALVFVLTRVIATPIYLVMWVVNFFKHSVGSFILYVIGKGILFAIVPLFILGVLLNLKFISHEQFQNWLNAGTSFAFGSSTDDLFLQVFPYPTIELCIVFGMAAIAATGETFGKFDKD